MNRGSNLFRWTLQSPLEGFNEAPIHESGKCLAQPVVTLDAILLQ